MNIDNLIKEWAKDIRKYDDMYSITNESSYPFDAEEMEYFDFIETHRNPKRVKAFFKDGSSKDIDRDTDILSFADQNRIDFMYKKQPELDYITIDGHKFDGRVLNNILWDIIDDKHKYDDEFDESEDMDKAKKLGYLGNEDNVAEWLKGDYAKWQEHVMGVFTRLANGDEEKAQKWFNTYHTLANSMVGMRVGGEDVGKMKDDLAKELGDDPEAKELIKKVDDRWEADRKALVDFYSTSSYQGD